MTGDQFQGWLDQQDFSGFDPSGYDWKDIFDQYGFDPSGYDQGSPDFDPSGYDWKDIFDQYGGVPSPEASQDAFDPSGFDWTSILDQYFAGKSDEGDTTVTDSSETNGSATNGSMTMQGGGQIEDVVIVEARMAILGQHQNPDQAIQAFIEKYGADAFLQLRNAVLQEQVPNAQTEGIISGQGGGMDDMVNGMIGNQQRIAVSPGEYIVPSDVVSMLGDGSSDSGADRLDGMLEKIRVNKTGTPVQAKEIDQQEVLPI